MSTKRKKKAEARTGGRLARRGGDTEKKSAGTPGGGMGFHEARAAKAAYEAFVKGGGAGLFAWSAVVEWDHFAPEIQAVWGKAASAVVDEYFGMVPAPAGKREVGSGELRVGNGSRGDAEKRRGGGRK